MTDKQTQAQAAQSNMERDPADWVTGDEPMTGAQKSYLKTLSEEAHEPFDDRLSKADASRRIDELQARTGRGSPAGRSGRGGQSHDESQADASPLESLGRAVAEPVLGSQADRSAQAEGDRDTGTPQRRREDAGRD